MASIQINRGTKTEIDNTPITDGMISFQTDDGYIYLDDNNARNAYGGDKIIFNSSETPTDTLDTIEYNGETYGIYSGHDIENQSGTELPRRDAVKISGAYTHDNEDEDETVVDIVREMTKAEKDALSNDAINGFQWVTDEDSDFPLTTDDIEYNGDSLTAEIDKLDDMSVEDLSDTDIDTETLEEGQIIGWDSSSEKWVNKDNVEVDDEIIIDSHNPVQSKVIYDFINNLLPEGNESGNPISISDASGLDAKGLTIDLEPIQDLNGYDSPWVGGSGKNKLNVNLANLKLLNTTGTWANNKWTYGDFSLTVNDDGSILLNGTPDITILFYLSNIAIINGNTYILSGSPTGSGTSSYRIDVRSSGNVYNNWNDSTSDTLVATEDITVTPTLRIVQNYTCNNILIKPMICLSTATNPREFAPYSNICPISGRNSVDITVNGKNLFDNDIIYGDRYNGVYHQGNNYWTCENLIPIFPNTTYTFSGLTTDGQIGFYDDNQTYISNVNVQANTTFTTPENAKYLSIYNKVESMEYNHQLELGSSATTYEPYNLIDTETIPFNETVYGGEVDVTSGGTSVNYGIIDLGSLEWGYNANWGNNPAFYTNSLTSLVKKPSADTVVANAICEVFEMISLNTLYGRNGNGIAIGASGGIVLRCYEYTDVLTFKNAMSGVMLCYELATPTTLTTSTNTISLNKGNNTLSTTDENGTINLKYSKQLVQ